ncbi:protein CHROMATIN REMODELING 35 isoform X4 [Brachypodium distachyon]|uniref:Uncharacterized protein n=1 Tax=Brachypodium distachyon TaxID=15368 RepID=A0A2K2DV17_BRADI|nr:protein CHROMATIN REMODELING 35 isoform X4 [Brachypodium distachyon]PNT78123.1 hypothetical protein BRADI_1g74070v3 [Brachypodium distachyon]|eukprot:XP_010229149.1 protein CHROMATIN REMODELING 35 isoform X4 [Brachypodium distachyon]
MDPSGCKRQKHEIEHDSSPGNQSQATIISHNSSVRLRFLEQFDDLKYASATKDYKAVNAKMHELLSTLEKLKEVPIKLPYVSPVLKTSDARLHSATQSGSNFSSDNIIDLDPDNVGDHTHPNMENTGAHNTTYLVDSGDGDMIKSIRDGNSSGCMQNVNFTQECSLAEQPGQYQDIIMLGNENINSEDQAVAKQGNDIMDIDNELCFKLKESALFDGHSSSESPELIKQGHGDISIYNENHDEQKGKREGEGEDVQSAGSIENNSVPVVDSYDISCEVIQSESTENGNYDRYDNNDSPVDELEYLWRDMSLALACSKTIGSDHSIVPSENTCGEVVDDCHHDFLMRDDLGLVCRVCGLIKKPIDTIIECQWKKPKQSYRTYPSGHRNSNDLDTPINLSRNILQMLPDPLSIHPQHLQQMKPHQLEGFNFLVKNLADEKNPGGCILAHAPGSGKTFMLISFVQSYLTKYPEGRPLIVLPVGILATWRTEFLRWQIEDIPLYDFYSSKANNRSDQLKVLNLWEENRSIMLLGYEHFARIVSEHTCDTETVKCRKKLLKVPSLVILDEGHTARNKETDLLTSLATIETPRKVVLSGTLFQNHVSEVFNILNLVRPNFLKMERSRAIVKRILSKVDMFGKSAWSKNTSDKCFYDMVEENLQKDANDKIREMIIENLRELTANVLHYYQGELSEELPGLVDFTVFLNMTTKQEESIKSFVGQNKFSKRSNCNAVSLHPCLKDIKNICEKNENTTYQKIFLRNHEKISSVMSGIDINDGAKLKFIHNLLSLSESAGEKVLVFSQYVCSLLFLEMLFTRMKGWKPDMHMFMIHGGSVQRDKTIERFNHSPDAKVLFGSIKACSEGISLVGASRVVILDVHENPSVMRQAIGRAFRPGQTKMVYCYRLVAADSPEEDDHKTAFRKERVAKLWFEWNEVCVNDDFELTDVDVSESEDIFLESPAMRQDIKSLYKR